ncbi:hypothetical protein DM860_001103 [Cuscuta australis]|uniref:Replication factor A C-terminal domain-containing protein n=1 Tax=Cuscuta australis TaxID=267555 RepID=A0A328DXF7_9ASTE|nr:hypothetical protein DM860_001103 [Cuscuta australis]
MLIRRFAGVSLSTRYDSAFEVNPSDPTWERWKKWRDESLKLINNYIEIKAYKNSLIALAYPPGRAKVKIGDISTSNSPGKGVWVSADIKILDNEGSYYIGCDYCNRKTTAPEGVTFTCLECGNLSARSEKRLL